MMGQVNQHNQQQNDRQTVSPFWKTPVTLALVCLLGLLSTGCGNNTTTTTTKGPTVRIWRLDQDVDPLRKTIDDFQKATKNSTISYTSRALDGYELESVQSMAARQGPDVWSIPNDWLGDHFSRLTALPDGFYMDSDKKPLNTVEQIRKLYPEGIADQLISDGKVHGLPANVESLQLYYNPSLMTAAYQAFYKSLGTRPDESEYKPIQQLLKKAPATWNDLVEQEKYITAFNDTGDLSRSTIALGTADNITDANDIVQLLMLQNGAKIVSQDRKNVLFADSTNTPSGGVVRPGEKALEFYTSFANPLDEHYTWDASASPVLDAFGKSKVAMVIAYPNFARKLKVKYPKLDYETAAVPQVSLSEAPVNLIRFKVESVTATAASSSTAFKLMKAYTTSKMAKTLATESKTSSPYLETLQESDKDNFQAKQILTGTAIYKKNHSKFDEAFRQMIIDASQNEIPPGDAVKAASETIGDYYAPATPDPKYYEKS